MTPYLILAAVSALIAAPFVIVKYAADVIDRVCEGDSPAFF